MRRRCLVCGKETAFKHPICDACFERLERVFPPLHNKTGRPLKSGYSSEVELHYLERNRSYCVYDDLAARIVKEFKYKGHFRIANAIAKKILTLIDIRADSVVPVPAPVASVIARGYNQSSLIANKVAKALGIPYLSPLKSLKRERQAGKVFRERVENVKNTVIPKTGYESSVEGKTLILIDDVFTTGSTLNEVSKVLTFMGAKKIYSFTFAITSKVES
jgi:competence protein ComFC